VIANYAVKLVVGRERPLIDDHPMLARAPSKLSFPSAHSTSSVTGAVALGRVAPSLKPALYGLAAAIGSAIVAKVTGTQT
jgi:undecaprenyl-diphosphatase